MFNLSTETGTYIAEGIVTHNCTVAFLTPDDMEKIGASVGDLLVQRVVPLETSRFAVRMIDPATFDRDRFRSALQEAAA